MSPRRRRPCGTAILGWIESATAILLILVLGLVSGLVLGGCGLEASGGGSDTETLTGTLLDGEGRPVPGASVKLVPAGFNPARPGGLPIRRTTTDDSGRFRFGGLAPEAPYNVLALERALGLAAFADSLVAGGEDLALELARSRVFTVTLFHEAPYPDQDSGLAYFPGTDILARCDGETAVIDSIPAGLRRLVVESRAGWRHDSLVTSPQDTVHVSAQPEGMTWR